MHGGDPSRWRRSPSGLAQKCTVPMRGKKTVNKLLLILIVIGLPVAAIGGYRWYRQRHRLTWTQVNAMIHDNFPQVPQLSVQVLHASLVDPHKPKPLLLDVRSRIEYEVSHLRHARWVNAKESVAQAMAGVPHDRPIVACCSVGYRSSAYCARLMRDGFTDVNDLKGSIFQWANAGFPVYRNDRIAHHVHPYNHHWGQLLKRSLWAFHPPPTQH